MTDTVKIVVQGTCQAGFIAYAINLAATLSRKKAQCLRVANWVRDPLSQLPPADIEVVKNCDVFINQVDLGGSSTVASIIPQRALTVTFPTMGMNWLWPFGARGHPKNKGVSGIQPQYVWGPYPRTSGDTILNRLMSKHSDPQTVLDEFAKIDPTKLMDLNRLFDLCRERARSVDDKADIRMWNSIETQFRKRRLFWDYGHANWVVMEPVCREILRRLPLDLSSSEIEAVLHRVGAANLLSDIHAPIHPKVAEHFGLEWYGSDIRFRRGVEGWFTFDECVKRYVEYRFDLDLHKAFWMTSRGEQLEEAENTLRGKIDGSCSNKEVNYILAQNLIKQRRYPEAISFSEAAMTDANVAAHHNVPFQRSVILERLGRLEESLAAAQDAVQMAQYPAREHCWVGLVLARLGRSEQAVSAFSDAIALDRHVGAYHFHKASQLRRLGKYHEAYAAFLEAVRCEPTSATYQNAAAALSKIVESGLPSAAATLRSVLKPSRLWQRR